MRYDFASLIMINRKVLLDSAEDPAQLSRRLNELPPTKRSACIVGLILRAATIPSKKELLMSLPEPQVLDIMEETREVCSVPP